MQQNKKIFVFHGYNRVTIWIHIIINNIILINDNTATPKTCRNNLYCCNNKKNMLNHQLCTQYFSSQVMTKKTSVIRWLTIALYMHCNHIIVETKAQPGVNASYSMSTTNSNNTCSVYALCCFDIDIIVCHNVATYPPSEIQNI